MPYPITPDQPLVEAGRQVMAAELAIVESHFAAVRDAADETGVHETRKAIRRTRTAMRVFGPNFTPDALKPHRRFLRKLMRRLAPSRDATVMLNHLDAYLDEAGSAAEDGQTNDGLPALRAALAGARAARDEEVCRYLARPRARKRLAAYRAFLDQSGAGALPATPGEPFRVAALAPVLLYGRLADVRAYEGRVDEASLPELHALRIRLKELRYSLEFFEAVLGPDFATAHGPVKEMLELLGEINDAHVAEGRLKALAAGADAGSLRADIAHYRAVQKAWIARDRAAFTILWESLLSPAWRQAFALAVAAL